MTTEEAAFRFAWTSLSRVVVQAPPGGLAHAFGQAELRSRLSVQCMELCLISTVNRQIFQQLSYHSNRTDQRSSERALSQHNSHILSRK